MSTILIKNATVLTVNKNKDILKNIDILVEDNLIKKIETNIDIKANKIINAKNKVIMPGFVQTHIHLCQTLFRGLAEDRVLLDWLRDKIWPYEASLTPETTYLSSMLGIGELLSGGTTTILDMGSVNHYDKAFEAISASGIRAMAGKAMMDSGERVPQEILETTQNSIKDSMELYEKWNNSSNGRIKYAFAPRFILSCSDNLFKEVAKLSDEYKIPVHTHAYENKSEGEAVVSLKGMREFGYFHSLGLLNERFLAAHCIWMNEGEKEFLKSTGGKVLHCPSSNFKLGSGMLNLKSLLDKGISVSIGADGAPCNNNLDMLQEIRTTALMQNVLNKPGYIPAYKYIELATIEGAKALGLDQEIGSVEIGKKADLIMLDLESDFHNATLGEADLATKIVYSGKSTDIKTVIIDGQVVMEDRELLTVNKSKLLDKLKSCK